MDKKESSEFLTESSTFATITPQASSISRPPLSGKLIWENMKREPLLPIGCFVTLGIVLLGVRATVRGEGHKSQLLMRARVGAQFLTLAYALYAIRKYEIRNADQIEKTKQDQKRILLENAAIKPTNQVNP